jgi:hypothetical protein
LAGAREVQEQVLMKSPNLDFKAYVLWTPSYTTDNGPFVEKGMAIFKDKRVAQYWDTGAKIAAEYGKTIELPRDAPLAYDVYFLFGKQQLWESAAPKPLDYMHQVFDDGKWFDPPKFLDLIKAELKK